jgi:hypothetical protein
LLIVLIKFLKSLIQRIQAWFGGEAQPLSGTERKHVH